MKTCRDCGLELQLSEFYKNRNVRDGHLNQCKKCTVARYGPGRSVRAKRDRLYFQRIKIDRGCADCGYNANPVALDFDHLPGAKKLYRVCTMAGMSRALIDAEIAKCEVVCANCHRIRTADRLNSAGGDFE
ncbi:hypothetical protein ACIQMY_25225 [Streptomyces sp. NPDC091368]|uniref:hypothetical protein n=1 Tax=Streptomyces sp. NPDC091368 TaxID=3365993 RepID=UPI003821AED6